MPPSQMPHNMQLTADSLRTATALETATHFAQSPAPPVPTHPAHSNSTPTQYASHLSPHPPAHAQSHTTGSHLHYPLGGESYQGMYHPHLHQGSSPMSTEEVSTGPENTIYDVASASSTPTAVLARRGVRCQSVRAYPSASSNTPIDLLVDSGAYQEQPCSSCSSTMGTLNNQMDGDYYLHEYRGARRVPTRRPSYGRGSQSASTGWMTTCLFCLVLFMIGVIVVGTLYMTQLQQGQPRADSQVATRASSDSSPTFALRQPVAPSTAWPSQVGATPPSLPPPFTPREDALIRSLLRRLAEQQRALDQINQTLVDHIAHHTRARSHASRNNSNELRPSKRLSM